VTAQAFITSQSAQAHQILFRRIFEIATEDTQIPTQFRHIHGVGFETVVADGHKGQGLGELSSKKYGLFFSDSYLLGLGKFCVELCHDREDFCPREPRHQLKNLNPYDHLRWLLLMSFLPCSVCWRSTVPHVLVIVVPCLLGPST